jgi:hypothetical protein
MVDGIRLTVARAEGGRFVRPQEEFTIPTLDKEERTTPKKE